MFDKIRQKAAQTTGIPKDIMLDLPLVTMVGNTEATVENFKGIIEYGDDVIRIKTSNGMIRIKGKKLLLNQVTSEIINISGVIFCLEFL